MWWSFYSLLGAYFLSLRILVSLEHKGLFSIASGHSGPKEIGVLWAGSFLSTVSGKLSHHWARIQHQAFCWARCFIFLLLGVSWAALRYFAHRIERAAVSNRQFLNLLAASEIKFQPIVCSRHSSLFQLCGLFCSFLRTSEIADWVTLISCSAEFLVLSQVLVSHLHQLPTALHSGGKQTVNTAWAVHLLRLNHIWGKDWDGRWSKADLTTSSLSAVILAPLWLRAVASEHGDQTVQLLQ